MPGPQTPSDPYAGPLKFELLLIQVGLRPVRRAQKLCHRKLLQSRCSRENCIKFCNENSLHETFVHTFFVRCAYVRMQICVSIFSPFFDEF